MECKFCHDVINVKTKRDTVKIFCNKSCAMKYRKFHSPPISDDQKAKISKSLKEYFKENPANILRGTKHAEEVGKSTRFKYKGDSINSILDVSKRTVTKILNRLNIGCSRCGWNESTCDIHHIKGRKIPNCDAHENLTLLCPNCHRLFHTHKIGENEVKNLNILIGDKWKDYYFG